MSASSEPIIGICAVSERARWSFWDQDAHLVADSYVSSVQRTGAIAVLLPVDPRAPLTLLDAIDGLLLIGGADIDPETYGAPREAGTEATYPERDRFELALLRGALERELPVLAICRGMQLLNIALGGTLQQDLVAPDGTHPHRRIKGTFYGNEHDVALEPRSLVQRATGNGVPIARCHHHQAVGELGEGLRVTGRADDGVVEAIEPVDGRWALGVQWHPETDDRSRLFSALHDAALRYATAKQSRRQTEPSAEPVIR